MELVLGICLLVGTVVLLRQVSPRADGSQPAFAKRESVGILLAILAVVLLALGVALVIRGIAALLM